MKKGWGLPLLGVLLATAAAAQMLPEQQFGEPWNGMGFGVRALGMGGAFTAVGDDFDGLYWNPGALVRVRDTQIAWESGTPYFKRANTFDPVNNPDQRSLKSAGSWPPDTMAFGFVTTAFKPWAAGFSYYRSYHDESLLPWQDDYYQGTFVLPINNARTAGLGINVKYIYSDWSFDHPFVGQTIEFPSVSGWVADVGMYYSIPFPTRDRRRELSIGFMGRNLAGSTRIVNTQRQVPSAALLGLAFTFDDIIPREKSVLAFNYDQALQSTLGPRDTQVRLGFEQSTFGGLFTIRMGYVTPAPRYIPMESTILPQTFVDSAGTAYQYLVQGRPSLSIGGSINLYNIELSLAVIKPTESRQPAEIQAESILNEVPEHPAITQTNAAGIPTILPVMDITTLFSAKYHFGVTPAAPYAKINVEPLVFAPKKGEVAVFTVDYKDARGIMAWSIEIKNSARVPVRTFSGKGAPPERLVWDGLDDRFSLTPDDDHTYTLTVRNEDDVETVTAPQSMRVFTPGEGPSKGDPTLINRINDENAKRELAAKEAVKPLITGQLKGAKEGLAPVEAPVPPPADSGPGAPVAPSSTISEAPPGSASPFGEYRGIDTPQILRVQVPTVNAQDQTMVLEYQTQQYIFKYLVREIMSLTEQNFDNYGQGVKRFMVQARYGNHLMVVDTPMEVVRGLKSGRLDERQWLRAATLTLDGQPIQPTLN